MRTVSCPDVARLLHRRTDGRLAGAEPEALELHLSRCDACRREGELLDWIQAGLREHRREAPSGFAARVQRRLSARPSRGHFPVHGVVPWLSLAAALGGVALLVRPGVQPQPTHVTEPAVAPVAAQPPAPMAVRKREVGVEDVADEPPPQAAAHRAPRSTLRVQYSLNLRAFPPNGGGKPDDPDDHTAQSLRERRRLRHQQKIQLGAPAGRRQLPFVK